MRDYENLILNQLLDRYERSAHFRRPPGESAPARGVFLPFDRRTLPDYWIEDDPAYRREVNRVARALADRGLVRILWAPLARDAEIAKVSLNLQRLEDAYRSVRRTPRRDKEAALRQVAERWLQRWAAASSRDAAGSSTAGASELAGDPRTWGEALLRAVLDSLQQHRALPLDLDLDRPEELDALCRVLDALATLAAEVPRRIFGVRVLGDSKALEGRLGTLLVRAARGFAPGLQDLDDNGAVLESLGLIANPQHLLVAGPLVLRHRGMRLDLAAFPSGLGLPAEVVREAAVEDLKAGAVLTIENLTSFHEAADLLSRARPSPSTLLLYLGGYHNRARRRLLVKLWQWVQQSGRPTRFYHWGDLDLGGMQIFYHLAERTGIPLQPWLMDRETYVRHLRYGATFDQSYRRRLQALAERPGGEVFRDLLQEILLQGRRVEQESIRPVLPA